MRDHDVDHVVPEVLVDATATFCRCSSVIAQLSTRKTSSASTAIPGGRGRSPRSSCPLARPRPSRAGPCASRWTHRLRGRPLCARRRLPAGARSRRRCHSATGSSWEQTPVPATTRRIVLINPGPVIPKEVGASVEPNAGRCRTAYATIASGTTPAAERGLQHLKEIAQPSVPVTWSRRSSRDGMVWTPAVPSTYCRDPPSCCGHRCVLTEPFTCRCAQMTPAA